MIGKSRMKGEKVVTSLVPYGDEKPSAGMVKSFSTYSVEIFWDPPKGGFGKYVLSVEKPITKPEFLIRMPNMYIGKIKAFKISMKIRVNLMDLQ